ncbi:Armadillo repeat-containing protein 8 [Triticum urartu]|uniref:Armadillo repeat-containing protein 8 n=1 Tax=Triticum urartu TaxID=4572 RepID=M7YHW8_TRIUA|nr:Armadillo repeat-containing protein 8 [Triticum urartu]
MARGPCLLLAPWGTLRGSSPTPTTRYVMMSGNIRISISPICLIMVVDACARALRMIYQSKQAPMFDVNNEKNMDFLLSLLDSENENVTELAANIISYSCNSNTEQLALCGAGVPQKLVSLFGGSMNLRDACLESMTAIIRNNWEVASRQIKTKLILVLLELIEEPGHVGDEAPLALTTLIKDSVELQKQAFSTNAVAKLSNHLLANTLQTRRAVTILLALAELCSKQEESRSQLLSGQVSTLILDALKHDCADIRVAACSCLKNISRSSKVLSAGRLSCDTVIAPLVQLLYDSSTSVQWARRWEGIIIRKQNTEEGLWLKEKEDDGLIAALGAICNIAVNLTPRKSVLLHSGVVSQLVHLSKSMDPTLRLKSVLALRNIMFLMNPKDKDLILKELTVSTLSSLICDSEHSVQEQTLALVQNLLDGYVDSVNYVTGEDGMVINAISRQLNSASATGVCIQGMLVLANMAAGNELNKEAVMDVTVPHRADRIKPSFVVNFLQSKDKQLRVATLWCILNLIYPNSDSSSTRVARLQNAGVISQVKNMINDPCLDCKLRVRMVLEHCLDNATAGFM